jgi:membrane protease subunit (stomatin/prohibitin family)
LAADSGAAGALEGMAVAGVLNALTTRTSITTILRVQAKACELFLLHTKSTPEALRMELSQALGAVRQAKPSQQASAATSGIAELAKLAEMLQAGLITREEFDALKLRLLHG